MLSSTKKTKLTYGSYSFYKKLSKPEQLSRYKIIEPLLIACKEAGFNTIHESVASAPKYRQALKARSELFLSLNGLITRLALNRGIKPEELDDLFSYCTISLDKALMRFDYSRNFAFTSFAFVYLRGAVLNFIRENSLIIQNAKDFQNKDKTVTFTTLEFQSKELDDNTIDYILGLLNDDDARLLIWYYGLNRTSKVKDTLTSLLMSQIDTRLSKVESIISYLNSILADE